MRVELLGVLLLIWLLELPAPRSWTEHLRRVAVPASLQRDRSEQEMFALYYRAASLTGRLRGEPAWTEREASG
jgi:hypothetical protein